MEEKGVGFIGGLIILDFSLFYIAKAFKATKAFAVEICDFISVWSNIIVESVSIWVGSILAIFGI